MEEELSKQRTWIMKACAGKELILANCSFASLFKKQGVRGSLLSFITKFYKFIYICVAIFTINKNLYY